VKVDKCITQCANRSCFPSKHLIFLMCAFF
jgi:hypothetical protein